MAEQSVVPTGTNPGEVPERTSEELQKIIERSCDSLIDADVLPKARMKYFEIVYRANEIKVLLKDTRGDPSRLGYKRAEGGCFVIYGDRLQHQIYLEAISFNDICAAHIENLYVQSHRKFRNFIIDTNFAPTTAQRQEKTYFIQSMAATLLHTVDNGFSMVVHLKCDGNEEELFPVVANLPTFVQLEISGLEDEPLVMHYTPEYMKKFASIKFRTVVSDCTLPRIAAHCRCKMKAVIGKIRPEVIAAAVRAYVANPGKIHCEWLPVDQTVEPNTGDELIRICPPISRKNWREEEKRWAILYRFAPGTAFWMELNIRTKNDNNGRIGVKFKTN